MSKSSTTAQQLALAKLEYEVAQAQADQKKKEYEHLRAQLMTDMVLDNVPRFEYRSDNPNIPVLSFRLETKERWSPVVDNKDKLYSVLKQEAPELFGITAAALTKFIGEIVAQNDGALPDKYSGLVKKYDDTHVVVREVKR